MNDIKNTEHLSQKDKEKLEYFFEKYSLAWYIEKEYKRLQNKTWKEQQGEKIKEGLAEFEATNNSVNDKYQLKYNPNVRNLNSAIFEFTDILRVFTKPIGNTIIIYDGYIEYEKTDDELKAITKMGSGIASAPVMVSGTSLSLKAAIAAGAASSVFLTPIGGTIVGIGVFVVGVGASYWASDNFGTALNAGMNGVIDYIRETDISFTIDLTSQEKEYLNAAHCHRTTEKMQKETRKHILINDYEITPPLINNKPNLITLKNMQTFRKAMQAGE